MAQRQRRVFRDFVPALVPALVGASLWLLGHGSRGRTLLVIAAIAAVAVAAGVDLRTPLSRATDAAVRGVTNVLSWAVGVFVFVPAWACARIRRRDPLHRGQPGGWLPVDSRGAADGASPSPRRGLRIVMGTLVLLLAADVLVGIGWNRVTGAGPVQPPGAIRIAEPGTQSLDDPDTVVVGPPDPRAELPAMEAAPWAQDYFQELNSVGSSYWPYTQYRPRSFVGEYVNIRDWERLGHVPSATAGVPVVALLGGSAAFGEGQRDEGTITSHLSRLAEDAGLPVLVRNFGQRGWVLWQEMTLYEQLLASGEQFDLAVFYDGANDLAVQTQPISGVPTHFDVAEYALRLAQPVPDPGVPVLAERGLWPEVSSWWRSRSALYRSMQATGWFSDPVAERSDPGGAVAGWERRGVDVYTRSRQLTQYLSEREGVTDLYFWQPQRLTGEPYDWAAAAVGPTTIDLTGVLDGREDVYLDNVHTNEEGARLVAEAMWPSIEPAVREWYRQRG